MGQSDAALADYDRALTLMPGFAMALSNRAGVLSKTGQIKAALDAYRGAIAMKPDYVDAYNNYALLLTSIGRFDEAVTIYRQVIGLQPGNAELYNSLGNTLHVQGKLQEAAEQFRQAIMRAPEGAVYYNNLGNIQKELGHNAEAVASYRKTLELSPNLADAHYNLGQTLRDMGEGKPALACFERALQLAPEHVRARWAYAMAHIPSMLDQGDDLGKIRSAIGYQFEALDRWFEKERVPEGYQAIGVMQPFYLAYQEENNRDLMEQHGELCTRLMRDWQQRNHCAPVAARPEGRVRVGIVSSHIRNHSVWFALVKGWLQYLNRNLIEIHLFLVDNRMRTDEETEWAAANAASFENIGNNLDRAVTSILARNLDILLYPEIGMEQIVQKLSSLRLCPTQMVSWGHPDTSGLSTIDYYLSAEDLEPVDAVDHYSELLIRLPHLGCCYQPLAVRRIAPDFERLGIRRDVPLLISPGVPFKYAPQNDHVFVDIVKRLGNCQIIFFLNRPQELSNILKLRLQTLFRQEGLNFDETCLFIPWLDRPVFYGLMEVADVFLDTIGFSGFNTAIQAIECGLPIVARDGQFMRGRLASGLLRRMELNQLIVATNKAYVDLAVRLATDSDYRQAIQRAIEERRPCLFDDREPVAALEKLLLNLADRL